MGRVDRCCFFFGGAAKALRLNKEKGCCEWVGEASGTIFNLPSPTGTRRRGVGHGCASKGRATRLPHKNESPGQCFNFWPGLTVWMVSSTVLEAEFLRYIEDTMP